jgi:hypothetical protein
MLPPAGKPTEVTFNSCLQGWGDAGFPGYGPQGGAANLFLGQTSISKVLIQDIRSTVVYCNDPSAGSPTERFLVGRLT